MKQSVLVVEPQPVAKVGRGVLTAPFPSVLTRRRGEDTAPSYPHSFVNWLESSLRIEVVDDLAANRNLVSEIAEAKAYELLLVSEG